MLFQECKSDSLDFNSLYKLVIAHIFNNVCCYLLLRPVTVFFSKSPLLQDATTSDQVTFTEKTPFFLVHSWTGLHGSFNVPSLQLVTFAYLSHEFHQKKKGKQIKGQLVLNVILYVHLVKIH